MKLFIGGEELSQVGDQSEDNANSEEDIRNEQSVLFNCEQV